MEIQQLRYFVSAAECGNVSRAAGRCHIAQPSLSQQLRKLEGYLGVTLFDRLGRGVALTDAGRALLPRARRILAEIRETEANLKRETQDCHGTLIVGAIPTMAPYLLPPALGKLRAAHPACEVSIREDLTENLVEALADNQLDCALVSTPLQHELIDLEVLGEEELLVAVSAKQASKRSKEIGLGDLRGEPAVILEEMHCLGRQIQGFCSMRRLARQVVCRTTQLSTILEMVGLGIGFSMVPEMAAAADRAGRCRYLRLRPGKPTREIAIAWRRNRSRPQAALQFAAAVRETLGVQVRK